MTNQKAKTIEDCIYKLTESIDFDELIIWADALEVEHDEGTWLDDMWPDLEVELRQEVYEALLDELTNTEVNPYLLTGDELKRAEEAAKRGEKR